MARPAPVDLVVLGGEVAGAAPVEERLAARRAYTRSWLAPRRRRDVHDVAPALVRAAVADAVDEVAVPPHRVAGLDGGMGQYAGISRRGTARLAASSAVVLGAAEVVVGDVVLQGAQQHVAHRLGIGTTCRTPSCGRISDSAVHPWNVRNAEHITVDGNSWISPRRRRPMGRTAPTRRRTRGGRRSGRRGAATARSSRSRCAATGRATRAWLAPADAVGIADVAVGSNHACRRTRASRTS